MNKKTHRIYFALKPTIEKEVSLKEKKEYLKCKFWIDSKEKADLFYAYYPGSVEGELHRIMAILNGWTLRKRGLMKTYAQITKLINLYRYCNDKDKRKRYLDKFPVFLKIFQGMSESAYPRDNLIDDVLLWAANNKIINLKTVKQINRYLDKVRYKLFCDSNISKDMRNEILRLLVENYCEIIYQDAHDLFFQGRDLLSQLSLAVDEGTISARYSKDRKVYYFYVRSLIKWLIKNNLISKEIISEFPYLEAEIVKESIVAYKGQFHTLAKLVRQGEDRGNLLSQAANGEVRLYLKYPRNYIEWRTNWKDMLVAAKITRLAEHRYDGLGELKAYQSEDTARCEFGGLTIDKLLYDEPPKNALSESIPRIDYEIEFVPTKLESDAGMQPYIKIPPDEIEKRLSDENLIVTTLVEHAKLINEVRGGEPQRDNIIIKDSASDGTKQEVPKVDKETVWGEVSSKLHEIAISIQRGNKMQLADNAICLILNAVKKLSPNFDPMEMPGTVEDFFNFCLDIPNGNKIFACSKETFGKYCRRTIRSSKSSNREEIPICGWSNPPTLNRKFWQELKPKNVSYKIVRPSF